MAANWTLTQVFNQLNGGEKWSGNTITYAFPTNANGMFSQGEAAGFRATNGEQQALMTLALATWDDLIAQSIVPGTPGSTNIEMAYTSTNIGYAHAYYPNIGSAWFNSAEADLVTTAIGQYGFQTFIHEIGHALGLNHMGDYNGNGNWSPSSFQDSVVLSIMSYFGPRYAAPNYSAEVMQADWADANGTVHSPQTPMLNDIMAIQQIYGASTTTRLGDTVYGFSSTVGGSTARIFDFAQNPNPILTLYDSGGTDTLDLSGWSTPSRIDLHAGAFSSANNMTNNIAIAYDTTIENARGGSGADVLTGNDIANRLEGGAGNDELLGSDGDDTLAGNGGNDKIDGGNGSDTAVFEGSFASYTISVAGTTVTLTGNASGSDSVTNVERFQFADGVRTLGELSPGGDSTAPVLTALNPADNAAGVSVTANLVLTFDEPVKGGNGLISIFNADGSLFQSITGTDTARVRFNGNTATIDPTSNLVAGASYYLVIGAGAITDVNDNAWGGLSGTTAWNFSTGTADTAPPQLVSQSPADDATSVARGANLTLTFNEAVVAGTGNITIRSGSTVVRTIAIGDTSQVTIDGSTVTINPAADLAAGTDFHVTVDAGALRDAAGNAYAGFSASTAWNFRTASGAATDDFPYDTGTGGVVVVNGSAASGTIEVSQDADLFSVNLVAGTRYTFTLQRTTGGLDDPYLALYGPLPGLAVLAEDDDGAGGGNSRISFTATVSGTYYLGALDYADGTGAYTLRATTDLALLNVSPADNSGQVNVGADLVLTFNEAVQAGNGSIRIFTANGSLVREIRANDLGVSINGASVTIDPGANLPPSTAFYINIDAGAFHNAAGIDYSGLVGTTAWNFNTAAPTTTDDYPLSVSTTGMLFGGGSSIAARIDSPNDGDLFKVQLTAGTTYRFQMNAPASSAVDPYLQLYGMLPEVDPIAYDDDSGGNFNALLYFTPSASGIYYLAAFDYSEATGTYTISSDVPLDDYLASTTTSGRVTVGGGAVAGGIGVPTDTDMFAITLNAGAQVTIDLKSTGLDDPYLVLFDGAGQALVHDDDTGVGLNSQITYTPATTGTYYLATSDFDTGTGAYTLSAFLRNVVPGSGQADTLVGGTGPDTLDGGSGNDLLRGRQGDDILEGGNGIDTARYSGFGRNFALGRSEETGWIVSDDSGSEGRDLLYGVERIQWDDLKWAIDIEGNAGMVAKILGAVFGPDSVQDQAYVGIGLQLADGGMGYEALMQLALDAALGSNASNQQIVQLLYANVVGIAPPAADLAYYKGLLDSGVFTAAELGVLAAESSYNADNIDLVGLMESGIGYV